MRFVNGIDERERLAVSVPEAAARLGLARSTAWELVWSGQLPSARVGHRVLVPIGALERWLEGRTSGEGA